MSRTPSTTMPGAIPASPSRLIDLVFPGDTNHHGTLFGGAGLALMDRIAFIAATRHGRVPFVTASVDRVDFQAPARVGELVELTARAMRVGRCTVARLMRSMSLEGLIRGKPIRTTFSDKTALSPLDQVNRQFKAYAPNRLWISDFTYVATWQGFV